MGKNCLVFLTLGVLFFSLGCSRGVSRDGVISQDLPLTLVDLSEIRKGENVYDEVLEHYRVFHQPRLSNYLNDIALTLGEVSERPHLPYRVVMLDSDQVDIFGGPGGYIFITRGMLNFVESEAEIAGLIAHEIAHISNYDYSDEPQNLSKAQRVHNLLLAGTALARDSIGTYGTAAHYAVKLAGRAAPALGRSFGVDSEIHADELAVRYLLEAGYNPHGLKTLMDRLSRVEVGDIGRFVNFMSHHPPFQDRRSLLDKTLMEIPLDLGGIEVSHDALHEVRQMPVHSPESILFSPQLGVAPLFREDFAGGEGARDSAFQRGRPSF